MKLSKKQLLLLLLVLFLLLCIIVIVLFYFFKKEKRIIIGYSYTYTFTAPTAENTDSQTTQNLQTTQSSKIHYVSEVISCEKEETLQLFLNDGMKIIAQGPCSLKMEKFKWCNKEPEKGSLILKINEGICVFHYEQDQQRKEGCFLHLPQFKVQWLGGKGTLGVLVKNDKNTLYCLPPFHNLQKLDDNDEIKEEKEKEKEKEQEKEQEEKFNVKIIGGPTLHQERDHFTMQNNKILVEDSTNSHLTLFSTLQEFLSRQPLLPKTLPPYYVEKTLGIRPGEYGIIKGKSGYWSLSSHSQPEIQTSLQIKKKKRGPFVYCDGENQSDSLVFKIIEWNTDTDQEIEMESETKGEKVEKVEKGEKVEKVEKEKENELEKPFLLMVQDLKLYVTASRTCIRPTETLEPFDPFQEKKGKGEGEYEWYLRLGLLEEALLFQQKGQQLTILSNEMKPQFIVHEQEKWLVLKPWNGEEEKEEKEKEEKEKEKKIFSWVRIE